MTRSGQPHCRLAAAVILSLTYLCLSGCSVNPATGTPDLVMMSESKEISIGEELHKKLLEKTPIYPDPELQAYVNEIGQKLVRNSHRSDIQYTFTLVDAPDINAFALPGGYIYVNRGLLTYLQNEAQLAAVIAHEIAHVTARHAVRQDTARKGSSVLSVAAAIATGSGVVGDVTQMWSTAAVMGYGREMELEADSIGAEYLNRSGYDPQAMIDVISLLKDQEKFSRRMARESGKKSTTYHGVFASHPRNDTRLQQAIAQAAKTERKTQYTDNAERFREKTQGMVFGVNYDAQLTHKNTFRHKRLAFEIDFPKGWTTENQRSQILAQAPDKSAQLAITIDTLKQRWGPDAYINKNLGIKQLEQSQTIAPGGFAGHSGIVPESDSAQRQRIAVIYRGRLVYTLRGQTLQGDYTDAVDQPLFDSILSFRPATKATLKSGKSKTIHYVRANANTTYNRIAQHQKLDKNAEQLLRLINGHYPRTEPVAGQWIKVIQ
ncbi:MAG: M48 family metalloprotease [Candidatus Pelagadaptatus aseana]|uniref:M48 family metalloprotease n=1 Tax=Candidatus Pelagadaptatus aseana TaxID=3120508 RepID=UPI0039B1629A